MLLSPTGDRPGILSQDAQGKGISEDAATPQHKPVNHTRLPRPVSGPKCAGQALLGCHFGGVVMS